MDLIPADLEPHSVPGTCPHIALETDKVPSAVESHYAAGDSGSGEEIEIITGIYMLFVFGLIDALARTLFALLVK